MFKPVQTLPRRKVLHQIWLNGLAIAILCVTQARFTGHALVQAASLRAPATQARVAIVSAKTAALLSAPGAEAIARLETGESVQATGRSADGQWVYTYTGEQMVDWAR